MQKNAPTTDVPQARVKLKMGLLANTAQRMPQKVMRITEYVDAELMDVNPSDHLIIKMIEVQWCALSIKHQI